MNELLEYNKISYYLKNIKNQIIHKKLCKISPLAIPLLLEFNTEKLSNNLIINSLENEEMILKEAL